MSIRLDRFLSESSPYTRRDVRNLCHTGEITVNGKKIRNPDAKILETDVVTVKGVIIPYRKFIYLMLNKPAGYLSATEDKHDPVVTELVPEEYRHYAPFPVGRLDKDTEGLLLLTNDGQFDHALTSPRKNVKKKYYAELDVPANEEDVRTFAAGMTFQDFTAKPALLEISDDPCKVCITISEGKFHQVKRMCERVGKTVMFLKRISIAALELDPELQPGKMRPLTPDEMEAVLQKVQTPDFE